MVVHTDDLSYYRGYDIRQYDDISYCDYFRLQATTSHSQKYTF